MTEPINEVQMKNLTLPKIVAMSVAEKEALLSPIERKIARSMSDIIQIVERLANFEDAYDVSLTKQVCEVYHVEVR